MQKQVLIPAKTLKQLNADAIAAGYPANRSDAERSRWQYLDKLLAFGRKNRDILCVSGPTVLLLGLLFF